MSRTRQLRRQRRARQLASGSLLLLIIAGGRAWPMLGYFIPLCMLAGVGVALFRGRKWCDWLCPRGAFLDAALAPASPGRKIPGFVRGLPFRLAVLALLAGLMAAQVVARWPHFDRIGLFFVNLLTATTVAGVIAALLLHQRAWCLVCPIGTLSALAGARRFRLAIDSARCVSCGLCARGCPIQIAPQAFKGRGIETVADRDCLKCGLCVAACPKQALAFPGPATAAARPGKP